MVWPAMRHGMRARRTAADHAGDFGFGLAERAGGDVGLHVRPDECSAKVAGIVIHAITMAKKIFHRRPRFLFRAWRRFH
jgi:hypothetical protein